MSIVKMDELLSRALRRGYAVGYFEAWDQYSLEGVLEAAEEALSPVILGFGGAVTNPEWLDGGGIEELTALALSLVERSKVPTALLFNEAKTFNQVVRGLRAGCNAVMLDSSNLPFGENVAVTRKVVEVAHAVQASTEAELGRLSDASESEVHLAVTTEPEQAAEFVAKTGVDALAVSIGNAHALVDGKATVDLDLLDRIHQCVPVPLVIHGGTSFPEQAVRPAIERGVAKFNYGTRLKKIFLEGVKSAIEALPEQINVHRYIGSRTESDIFGRGKDLMKAEIIKLMNLYGSAGQAAF
jgi:fructose-bisphosphate aldolase class II